MVFFFMPKKEADLLNLFDIFHVLLKRHKDEAFDTMADAVNTHS